MSMTRTVTQRGGDAWRQAGRILYTMLALLVLLSAVSLCGCGANSTMSLTCKPPMEAKVSNGAIATIGGCDSRLGGKVAHVTLKPGQSVVFWLLQKSGLGAISVVNGSAVLLQPMTSPGSVESSPIVGVNSGGRQG